MESDIGEMRLHATCLPSSRLFSMRSEKYSLADSHFIMGNKPLRIHPATSPREPVPAADIHGGQAAKLCPQPVPHLVRLTTPPESSATAPTPPPRFLVEIVLSPGHARLSRTQRIPSRKTPCGQLRFPDARVPLCLEEQILQWLQLRFQRQPGAVEPALHGADRQPHNLRNLFVRLALRVIQHNHRALIAGRESIASIRIRDSSDV